MIRLYIIYDGRARYDTDKASVLETCDTLEEAIEDCRLFAPPSFDSDLVVYSYDDSGDYLADERLEYDPKSN